MTEKPQLRFTDAAAPARNIRELADYLGPFHSPRTFLYRGQARHYDSLVPSQYRGAVNGRDPRLFNRILLSAEKYHAKLDERGKRRFSAAWAMQRAHGSAVGTVISQQYGLTSECLDVTSDILIAAFFATHRYPEYRPIDRSKDLGVIYRFDVRNKLCTTVEDLDFTLAAMGGVHGQPPPIWWTAARKPFDLGKELHERALNVLGKCNRKMLFSHPLIVSYDVLRAAVADQLQRFFGQPIDIDQTRIGRQHGGFIRPSVHWRCAIADQVTVYEPKPGLRVAFPPIAIKEDLIGVDDTLSFPGLDVFYFNHTPEVLHDVNRERLWPSKDEDLLYWLMYSRMDVAEREYLDNFKVAPDDRDHGILDRGYYDG